jgi:hypothetical protein
LPTLTPAQIQLAYDIEAIQEALASGFVLPPLADVTDELPEPAAAPEPPAPFSQQARADFDAVNRPPVDPTPWTNPAPIVPATTPVDTSTA